MSIYLTLDNLNDLISSKSLKILKKNQKENGTNYYFTPNLVLKLYGAKVIFINPKFLVFQFCKIKNSSLYLLLKSIMEKCECGLIKTEENKSLFANKSKKRPNMILCKKCYIDYRNKYNKNKIQESRETNREYYNDYQRKIYNENKEKHNEYQKAWREKQKAGKEEKQDVQLD